MKGASGKRAPVSEQLLYLDELTRVTRRRLADGSSVICKEALREDALKRVRHERRILERLAGVQGISTLAEGAYPPSMLAMVDREARPLSLSLPERGMEIAPLLKLAAELARILAEVHGRGVVHRNLTPESVLTRKDGALLLVDFSLATTFAEQRPPFLHHREIAGNLPYLAPEQTGRTGRSVEQRADLYALGATLYHLAVGRPPFQEKDPLKLVHDILAEVPIPPAWHRPGVPQALSDLIMRLMEKEPDRRYQSAQGVEYDLARLAGALEAGETGDFALGERDFAATLAPPSRLVGREREIGLLTGAFEAALAGEGRGVLLSGSAGVGKSALINQLRPLVTARHGFFAFGKFDQYRRDLASDAIYQALRALGRLLLAEPEEELSAIREKLLRALGANAPLIASLQPEFALLLGFPHEGLPEALPASKERLIQATLDLVGALPSPKRPLVLVLDDLQWGGATPLAFLEALFAKQPIENLLVVGSFREKGLELSHPLSALLDRCRKLNRPPLQLKLDNLPPDELADFLKEMLRLETGQAQRLCAALAGRTDGNPYHTVELLNALRLDGVLSAGEHGWSWDEGAIRRYVGEGDVLKLLQGRMQRLQPQAQSILETAAALGGEVEPEVMALAGGLSAEELEEALIPCFEEGLLLPREAGGTLRFPHDRVQQAAYGRIPARERARRHLELARRLAVRPELDSLAAEQYLPALGLVEAPQEIWGTLVLLRRAAGRMRVVNYQEAEVFLDAALRLLSKVQQPDDLPLLIALESERHAALYALGRFEEADRLYRSIEERTDDPLLRAPAATLQIRSLTNRSHPAEAVKLGIDLLRELGVAVPGDQALELETARQFDEFKQWLGNPLKLADRDRAELKEPAALAAARLMNGMIPPAFFCGRALTAWWLVLECRRLWAEHGPCAALVGPLSHLGFASVAFDEYRSGCQAVKHVLSVAEARGWEPDASQARFLYALSVGPWFDSLPENVIRAQRAHEGLLQGGDLQNACHTYYPIMQQLIDCAPTLECYAAEIDNGISFAQRTGNLHIRKSLTSFRKMVQLLRGEQGCEGGWDEEERPTPKNPIAAGMYHNCRALCAAIGGRDADLAREVEAMRDCLPGMLAAYSFAQASILTGFSLALQAREASVLERPALWERFREQLDFLTARATDAPDNFQHLVCWLTAERAWADGEFQRALASFDAALERLQGVIRPWHRALITERAALFHLQGGLKRLGRMLMEEARQLYHDWGASTKVRRLEAEYGFLRESRREEREAKPAARVSTDAIDMLAILRASQALSSETSLERLTAVVVELMGTMTGATNVSLLVERTREWYLLPSDDPAGGFHPLPLARAAALGMVPLSVFYYAERTRQPLIVDDAISDDRFNHDQYFAGCARCSLLAVPILSHGAPRALLLLENRLSRVACNADLIDAVTLIAGQLAVSLENALLYQKLEERVRERTRELQETQSELMAAARQAGMAEIANNVLHNVGNVLNSVNVSAELLLNLLRNSRVAGVAKSAELLEEHAGDLGEWLAGDPQGRLLPGYLMRLAPALAAEQRQMQEELGRLTKSVNHIKEIVATQQCYAGSAGLSEQVDLRELVEDALRMNMGALTRHEVTVVKEYGEIPLLPLDRPRLLQILVNLISNAKQAMDGVRQEERLLTLTVELAGPSRLRITVRDRGEGIPTENLSRIFNHGFTTRKGGHGFGLHSCALAAKEMGGTLSAESEGPGRGALFKLEIPVRGAEGEEPVQ